MKNKLTVWLSLAVFFYLPFASAAGPNLGLFVIMHDQLTKYERAELGDNYLNPFLAQLQEITGRRTTVTFINDEPGLTDFAYRGEEDEQSLYTGYFRRAPLTQTLKTCHARPSAINTCW
ncbi:Uncharacterized protein AC509_2515 [Pseudomonas amygdali pv. morsprunorum]|nr:Uncharacterized protein AC509_2515 [Pseudomonas amygdali pv. morsprunorum]